MRASGARVRGPRDLKGENMGPGEVDKYNSDVGNFEMDIFASTGEEVKKGEDCQSHPKWETRGY